MFNKIKANKKYYLPHIFSVIFWESAIFFIPISGIIITIIFAPFFFRAAWQSEKDKIPNFDRTFLLIFSPTILGIIYAILLTMLAYAFTGSESLLFFR